MQQPPILNFDATHTALVRTQEMHWTWIQDTPYQGRAICRELGLALLVVYTDGPPYVHWRYRGTIFDIARKGHWN